MLNLGRAPSARAARLGDQDGTNARRRWNLDAGTCRSASSCEGLFGEESRDRSGPDLLGIQAAANRRARDKRSGHPLNHMPVASRR
jgi:hypothetical protein